MINTVDTTHQLLINNHFHILNAAFPKLKTALPCHKWQGSSQANYLFSFSYKAGVP